MDVAVEVRDLVVVRGRKEVLHGINLSVPTGEVTGLLGPSGSGKTTLMRSIVGVQKIRSGTVTVLGQPAGSAPLRSRVGYLTQAPSVYADLTVRENVRYFASLYKGVTTADADQAIADVGLSDAADQLVRSLSGGQFSRASLACALVGKPDVLILDEPTVGLDPVLRDELWRQFRELAAAGKTLLVSSHVMDEASRCDRLVLIRLRHDRRTVALIILVPVLLLTLVYYLFEKQPGVFDQIGLIMLGLFPFAIMFLITSIAMLRERTSGTLERLLTTPLAKPDLLFGYGLSFGLVAAVQAGVATGLAYWAFGLATAGSAGLVILIAVADAVLGMALGLFFSAFATSEFQAVQFMPAVVFPQIFLCGLFAPREQMAGWMHALSNAMPLTYAVQGLQEVGRHAEATGLMWRDLTIVAGCIVLALSLAAATLRRRTD